MSIKYKVEFKDDPACSKSGALAASANGCVRTSIPRYDGKCDMALIEVPDAEAAQNLEKLMAADSNVLSHKLV
ncbi:MAG: hypothetical protein QFE16_16760 [Pseudomonadota bacterium]|nr:hypothetical protein [Pseudomonadota bacterium]